MESIEEIVEDKDKRWRYPRFFGTVDGDRAAVYGEDAKHISSVLRMKAGELLVLCDGEKNDFLCKIVSAEKELAQLEILEQRKNKAEPDVRITLYQCLPKGDKFDFIVQKAVELGVHRIVPVISKRCVSRPDSKSAAKKVSRWQKISEEAAKQCGRGIIPEIDSLVGFEAAVKNNRGLGILLYECGGERLNRILEADCREIGIFVGSEGGFEKEEAELAVKSGIKLGTLGTRILRCETAPIAALAVLMNLTGNI